MLDLGGMPEIWELADLPPLHITILNLPGVAKHAASRYHTFHFIDGDACKVAGEADRKYDLVFSNSVIEHVGDSAHRAAMSNEIKRLGHSYWVQTPSVWFPIEAHCGMPFWWLYPESLRSWFISRWRKRLPAWASMVEGTTAVRRSELTALFPDATIVTERFAGIPKSYAAYRIHSHWQSAASSRSI